MKKIDTSQLAVGDVTQTEYYDAHGDLLISKGVSVSPKHLEALRRRNIFHVYTRESGPDSEIEELLSKEIEDLGELDFDDKKPRTTAPSAPRRARALDLPEFQGIREGRDGLDQLLSTQRVSVLDKKIEFGKTLDQPTGEALRKKMKQLEVSDRDERYKSEVSTDYEAALKEVIRTINYLAGACNIDGGAVRGVVQRFLRTFVTDRNILLCISGSKPSDGDYIYHHSLNVCLLALNIAAAAGYSENQIVEIGMGALLHDVGMLLVAEEIRRKRDRLTKDEWYEVHKHPILGLHLLERLTRLPDSVPIVAYQTHERENGVGYPRRRGGRLIHRFAKIVGLADIYEAVSSPRCYRPAAPPYNAMEMLVKMARQGMVSGDLVKAFLEYTSLFPVGSIVELSDHRIARVVAANGTSFTKPVVSIVVDGNGRTLDEHEIYQVDLKVEADAEIVRSHRFDYLDHTAILTGF